MSTDPRAAGGDIAGHGLGGDVVIDTRDAVLLHALDVARLGQPARDADDASFVMLLGGRINQTTEQSRILYLLNVDGAAAIVAELIGLAERAGDETLAEFAINLDARLQRIRAETATAATAAAAPEPAPAPGPARDAGDIPGYSDHVTGVRRA